jgi:hypothetical protein
MPKFNFRTEDREAVVTTVLGLVSEKIQPGALYNITEAALWGGLAWYCYKHPFSQRANRVWLLVAITAAVVEAYYVGRSSVARDIKYDRPVTTKKGITKEEIEAALARLSVESPETVCPSGIPAGAKVVEIPPDHLEGSDASAYYDEGDDDKVGHWNFCFSLLNNNKDYCVTGVEYEVDIQSDNGPICKGHGKQHIKPLSPGFLYQIPFEGLKFAAKPANGAVSSWKIKKGYGFPLTAPASH